MLPDPSAAMAVSPAELPVTIHAVRSAWLPAIAMGALIGVLGGGLALLVAGGLRPTRGAARRLPGTAPRRERAWLQIVAGARRDSVQRGVCELAARSLARSERVVVMDLGARLDLHALFGLSPRLGWADVARDRLPVLGVLQSGRMGGLFLLARGREGGVRDWLALDRALEELRPHFGRVIMAVDRSIPAAVGGVLAGRIMDGWWAGGGTDWARVRSRVGACLAISLDDIDLSSTREASLEGLEARLAGLSRDSRAAAPAVRSAAESRPVPMVRPAPSAPVVLDCDLQLRHRLRFMAWMRRVQAERRSREPESAPRA
jgi:hypothetical protein